MNIMMTALIMSLINVKISAYGILPMPLHKLRQLIIGRTAPVGSLATRLHSSVMHKSCYMNNILFGCTPVYPTDYTSSYIKNINTNFQNVATELEHQDSSNSGFEGTAANILNSDHPPLSRRKINQWPALNNMIPIHGRLYRYDPRNTDGSIEIDSALRNAKLNMNLDSFSAKHNKPVTVSFESWDELFSPITYLHKNEQYIQVTTAAALTDVQIITVKNTQQELPILERFDQSLDNFERKFYATTFSKLTSISPPSKRENGMSYVQSALFLQLALMALSTEVDPETKREIDECLGSHDTDQEKIDLINATMSSLPASSDDLKFRWSSRLVLQGQGISDRFQTKAAPALRLQIDKFNGTETPKEMAVALNHMVEIDSGGAIHNTFEEEDMSEGVRAVLITTLYLRARWRSAPTLLNGTRPFRDSDGAPQRAARMIRVNDVMRYALLEDWDAEALEIFYSTPGLSLLMLVPRGNSLRRLADEVVSSSLRDITARMRSLRVAATLPLYTLRMTLLLPNKLELMNISRLVDTNSGSQDEFRLSHAVQRIMFWAEAGRNAFKDDGLEWDEPPEQELLVDRPYIFYVRWKNKTLMNGNFVL